MPILRKTPGEHPTHPAMPHESPEVLIEMWAALLNVPPSEVERAVRAVGYDGEAVRDFIADSLRQPRHRLTPARSRQRNR